MTVTPSIIVPAAGKGLRMGQPLPKQYLPLNGIAILERTLAKLWELKPKHLCLVVSEGDDIWKDLPATKNCVIALGGSTRAESVLSGLSALSALDLDPGEMVLVHDAVRPLFHLKDVLQLIAGVGSSEHGGLLAVPVVDTLKETNDSKVVQGTPDRRRFWQAQTPQLFQSGLLQQALIQSLQQSKDPEAVVTDEASAMEALGYQPRLIEGSRDNIKLTTPEDLSFARYLLALESGDIPCE